MSAASLLPLVALGAGAVAAVLVGATSWLERDRPQERAPTVLTAVGAIVALLAAVAAGWLAPAAPRALAAVAGTVGGAAFVILAAWLPGGDGPRPNAARASLGVAAVGLAALAAGSPLLRSYALAGGMLGAAAALLPFAIAGTARAASLSTAVAAAGVAAAGTVWGDRVLAAGHTAGAWGVALATVALLVSWATSGLPRVAAPLAACAATAALAWALGRWGLDLRPAQVLPALLGTGLAAALAIALALVDAAGPEGPFGPWSLALVAGGTILLANRLFGMEGVALAGIGLLPLLAGTREAGNVVAVLISGFGARAFLQVYLDRTYLHQFGVDMVHPYVFFGLVAALLAPYALAALRPLVAGRPALLGLAAAGTLALPLLIGWFVHPDPLASYLAGLLVVTYVLGVLAPGVPQGANLGPILPPLVLGATSLALLAGPWLIQVLNAPRAQRLVGFGVLAVVALGYAAAVARPRPDRRAAEVP